MPSSGTENPPSDGSAVFIRRPVTPSPHMISRNQYCSTRIL